MTRVRPIYKGFSACKERMLLSVKKIMIWHVRNSWEEVFRFGAEVQNMNSRTETLSFFCWLTKPFLHIVSLESALKRDLRESVGKPSKQHGISTTSNSKLNRATGWSDNWKVKSTNWIVLKPLRFFGNHRLSRLHSGASPSSGASGSYHHTAGGRQTGEPTSRSGLAAGGMGW